MFQHEGTTLSWTELSSSLVRKRFCNCTKSLLCWIAQSGKVYLQCQGYALMCNLPNVAGTLWNMTQVVHNSRCSISGCSSPIISRSYSSRIASRWEQVRVWDAYNVTSAIWSSLDEPGCNPRWLGWTNRMELACSCTDAYSILEIYNSPWLCASSLSPPSKKSHQVLIIIPGHCHKQF